MAENELEARVERVEANLTSIKVDLGVLKAAVATKSDIAELKANSATKSDIVELNKAIAESNMAIAESRSSIILWVVSVVILAQVLPSLLKYFG